MALANMEERKNGNQQRRLKEYSLLTHFFKELINIRRLSSFRTSIIDVFFLCPDRINTHGDPSSLGITIELLDFAGGQHHVKNEVGYYVILAIIIHDSYMHSHLTRKP